MRRKLQSVGHMSCDLRQPYSGITVPNQKDVQADLMAKEQGLRRNVGLSLWVATGIKLQETQ